MAWHRTGGEPLAKPALDHIQMGIFTTMLIYEVLSVRDVGPASNKETNGLLTCWPLPHTVCSMGLLPDTQCRERFPRHRLRRKPLVSEPGMHHGSAVMHVGITNTQWRGNVPGIPGACATRNFAYLVRGPWLQKIQHGVVDGLEPIWCQNICNHYGGVAHGCSNVMIKRLPFTTFQFKLCKFRLKFHWILLNDNESALVQTITWLWTEKPLSESMMAYHIDVYVTQPWWVSMRLVITHPFSDSLKLILSPYISPFF